MSPHSSSDSSAPLRTDDRGVSEVLGAILVFGLIIAVIVLIQANAVPAANKQVEFEHNQRVTQDFQSMQEGLYRVGTTGSDAAVAIETGISYPPRFFLLNPAPSVGSLRTTPDSPIQIDNAIADGEVGDYWNGSTRTYQTRAIQYRPDYNELPNAGTLVWEHSTLYTRYDDTLVFEDPTGFIDGNQIRLTLVEGGISRGALSTSVEIAPVSSRRRTVTIHDDRSVVGDNMVITITSSIPDSEWADALAGEPATVTSTDETDDTVTIQLNDDTSYQLSVAAVRIGTDVTPTPDPAYLTDVSGDGASIPENSTERLTVEARDAYNNPVASTTINASVVSGPGTVTVLNNGQTDSDGQIQLAYRAPANVDATTAVRVRAAIDGSGAEPRRVHFGVDVLDSDGSGGSSNPGGGSDDGVSSINPQSDTLSYTGICSVGQTFYAQFENRYTGQVTIDRARYLFYTGNSFDKTENMLFGPTTLVRADDFASVGTTFNAGETLALRFEPDVRSSAPSAGDLFGISTELQVGGQPTRANYFIQWPNSNAINSCTSPTVP